MPWLRQDAQNEETPSYSNAPRPNRTERPTTPEPTQRTEPVVKKKAVIGPSIKIKGELTGDESLTIDGTIEGKITLKGHTLTLGPDARIKANVEADAVVVAGEITGDIEAVERIEITSSGTVKGDVSSPRITIADGACLKGSVDTNRGREVAKMEMPRTSSAKDDTKTEKDETKATA
jgi:cytoskeletal protein CcmA (bactofilin family)